MAAEEDDFRVEARLANAGRYVVNVTPEYVQELQARREALDKINRQEPQQPFADVLAQAGAPSAPPPAQPSAQLKNAALPKMAPRPGLRRPGERDTYGVKNKVPVVLKG